MGPKKISKHVKIPIIEVTKTVSFAESETEGERGGGGGGQDGRKESLLEDDDAASVLSIPAELPPPPDGGWGWMVVVASFLCNLVVDGISYSFSPYLDVYAKSFDAPKGTIAWVPSLLAGVYLMAGPFVSSLSNRYGCRVVCISGGLLAGVAYASTIFATSIEYLMVTQGFVAGFGFGLIYLPAVVTVGYYFEKKRALATGIAVCGSGVGTFIFPPVLNALIDQYGWKGTNLIIAGVIFNCCWLGGLMRPLKVPKMKKKDLMQRLTEERRSIMEESSLYGSNYMSVTLPDGLTEKRPYLARAFNADPGVNSHLNLSGHNTPRGTSFALPPIKEGTPPVEVKEDLTPKISSKEEERQTLVDPHAEKKPLIAECAWQARRSIPSEHVATSLNDVDSQTRKSMPNFERRLSKLDAVGQLKLIPATPNASYTNLRSLHNSQDLRRGSGSAAAQNSEVDSSGLRRRSSKDINDIELKVMSRQDIFYAGSINRLDEFKRDSSFISYRESTINIPGLGASKAFTDIIDGVESLAEEEQKKCCPESMRGTFSQMMDVGLLKNPVFLLIGFANLLGMLGFYTPFVYLPSAAMEKGIDKDSATFLVSIIGITNTIGRVLAGLIADIPRVNALWVNNMCITFTAACVFFTPYATTYEAFVCIAVFFGFFVSPFIALTSIILVDQFGLRLLSNSFGLLCIFRGVAGVLGPPVAGSIYDATKNYDISFWSAGILLFICALLHCIIPCVQRWCSCYESPVRYTTNEEYIKKIPVAGDNAASSPDAAEGAGIVFDIKPKKGSFASYASSERMAAAV